MQSVMLPVGQCPDQETLLDRVVNQPFHISRDIPFSAYMSHVSALANICPAMHNVTIFLMDGKSQFKSHAEINCFLLTFIISVTK
jgi:hypothetical protein